MPLLMWSRQQERNTVVEEKNAEKKYSFENAMESLS